MKLRAATALLAMIGTNAASAAPGDECISISPDLDRLACYDKSHGKTPQQTTSTTSAGAWIVKEETSALTDDKNVFLYLESDDPVDCGWNNNQKIVLAVMCHENKTALYFNTGCHMVSSEYNDYGTIEYRVDAEKARKINGVNSTDNKALGLWSGGTSIPVIKQLLNKQKLVARMTPYGESPFTATFSIAGLEKNIEALRAQCKW